MSAAALEHLHSCARFSFCADASPPRCRLRRIEGHYTGHFKSVVTNNKQVFVMRDIACADYVAGCNTKFFASGRTSGGLTEVSAEKCKENMMKRLAFADDVGAPYDSMLAFPAAAGQFINGALDTVMSITSRCARLRWTRRPVQMGVLWADRRRVPRRRLLPWEVQSARSPNSHNSFPGGEAMYVKYANALQLHSIHFGEDMKASENMEFIVLLCAARTPLFSTIPTAAHPSLARSAPGSPRARQTMHCVSSGRTAASTRLRAASTRSSPDKVTLDPMLFRTSHSTNQKTPGARAHAHAPLPFGAGATRGGVGVRASV